MRVVGDYVGLRYLGNAGKEVFEVKCGHKNYKTGGYAGEALVLDWDIGVWAPKIIKLVLCWGGVGGCGELVWTGILGGRREGGVLKLRCEHKNL